MMWLILFFIGVSFHIGAFVITKKVIENLDEEMNPIQRYGLRCGTNWLLSSILLVLIFYTLLSGSIYAPMWNYIPTTLFLGICALDFFWDLYVMISLRED